MGIEIIYVAVPAQDTRGCPGIGHVKVLSWHRTEDTGGCHAIGQRIHEAVPA
jgi:hypothetical protein